MNRNNFVSEYGELSNEILLNIAELLTLQLPEGIERIIASKWVKKFNACDPKAYQQYLSLFVSCLTKQLLVEPFDKAPKDMSSQWNNFDKEYTQQKINNAVIRRLYKDSFTPPYQLDMSSDLKEYVAFQEIPFFGAHFYYAFSPRDRIDKWLKFNKMNVPKSLVEILRKDELIESPIKGRLFPRPKSRQAEVANVSVKPKVTKTPKSKKADWQDLIPQEESEQEPERKQPTIIIPTDVPAKNIPAALQRRMAKAEQERQEKLSKKAQESKDRLTKLAVPKKLAASKRSTTSKPSTSMAQKKQLKKIIKGIKVDDIDASLMSAQPPQIQMKPKSPEFKAPHADLQHRLFQLRQSNVPPSELIKTTHDIHQASADVNKEAERLKREGTADLQNVERLHNVGLSVGNRILNMLKEYQADEIEDVAECTAGALENVILTMEQVNKMLKPKASMPNEALRKLNEIKENMQQSAFEAQNISIRMKETKLGHELIEAMDNMVNVNENSAYQLQNLQADTQQEGILIDDLENSSQQVAENIQAQKDRLSKAIENCEPVLFSIIQQTVKTVDEILFNSFNEDSQLLENVEDTSNVQQIIEIETQRNEQLFDLNERAKKILDDVEAGLSKIMDASENLIDVDNEDLGFSDIMDENEMERQRQFKMKERQERLEEIQAKSRLIAVDDSENLEDVSSTLIDEIESSIVEIDQVLIPGLQKMELIAETQKDRQLIHDAIEAIEKETGVLNNYLIEITNLNEDVAPEPRDRIEGDLINFDDEEEEDLIKFD